MPRPRQISDEQIRSAAREVFQQVGINAPVALVAKALGVTPAALFHRTGSKEQLFVMAMTAVEPRRFKVIQALRSGPSSDTPVAEQLIEILTRLSAHLAVVSPNLFLMFAAGKKPTRRRGLSEATRHELTAWLERAKSAGAWHFDRAAMMAEALVGSIEARHVWGFLHRRRTSVKREQQFVRELVGELLGSGAVRKQPSSVRGGVRNMRGAPDTQGLITASEPAPADVGTATAALAATAPGNGR